MSYEYGIGVHFEATCWEIQLTPRLRKSEIIEWTAVLCNFKTGQIEAEFREYLKPTEDSRLSDFCIKLTQIQQFNVDNGVMLQTAFTMFENWLKQVLTPRNLHLSKYSNDGNVAFVTWTDWEFEVLLDYECKRKNLIKPEYFNHFIDLRDNVHKRFNIKWNKIKFVDALKRVGLDFTGSKFSGMDDVRNLAALAFKLVNDGATLVKWKQ